MTVFGIYFLEKRNVLKRKILKKQSFWITWIITQAMAFFKMKRNNLKVSERYTRWTFITRSKLFSCGEPLFLQNSKKSIIKSKWFLIKPFYAKIKTFLSKISPECESLKVYSRVTKISLVLESRRTKKE